MSHVCTLLIWHKHSVDYLKFSFHCDKSNLAPLQKCVSIILIYVMSGRRRGWSWRLIGCECILIMELTELWLEHGKRKTLHTSEDPGLDSWWIVMDGNWCLCFRFKQSWVLLRKERMGSMSGLKLKQLWRRQLALDTRTQHTPTQLLPRKCTTQ